MIAVLFIITIAFIQGAAESANSYKMALLTPPDTIVIETTPTQENKIDITYHHHFTVDDMRKIYETKKLLTSSDNEVTFAATGETHIYLTPPPTATPLEESPWMPFLSTAYSGDITGNRSEKLVYGHSAAMWQTRDGTVYTNYANNCVPEYYKQFFANPEKYGVDVSKCALPYGTKFNMRIWTGSSYKYYYDIKVVDDSPTTQYALTSVAQNKITTENLVNGGNIIRYSPPQAGYKNDRIRMDGKIYINPLNWKEEYSGNIYGWLDFYINESWGTKIVEIQIIKQ